MLSTPPAFILSQDQTLMLKSFFLPVLNWLNLDGIKIYCFKVTSYIKKCSFVFRQLEIHLESFKVYSLFSYQCSFCCCCCSQRQLIYYITFRTLCQQLFQFIFSLFSKSFSVVLQRSLERIKRAEKEGFEPSRRC